MSKFSTLPRNGETDARRDANPAVLTLVTRVLPSPEQQAADSATSRRSSLRRTGEEVPAAAASPADSEPGFEYVQALENSELREMRESERAATRIQLPRLDGYESAEVVVQLDLPAERIRATGLDRLALTLSADPAAEGFHRLAAASDTEASLVELLQAKLKRVTIILRRAAAEPGDAGADPTAYGPHPRPERISRLTLSAVGRMAVVPAF